MRCYRKLLHISYKDHVTNKEVCAKIQQVIGPHGDHLTIVKRRKLQWYGHVSRSSGLAKTHLARHSERGKKTRQTEEAMEFAKSQRAVENRGKWRKQVAKLSVVPIDLVVKG